MYTILASTEATEHYFADFAVFFNKILQSLAVISDQRGKLIYSWEEALLKIQIGISKRN